MGEVVRLKCKQCGNTLEHWEGVGFESQTLQGDQNENKTGSADVTICCPQCGSADYESMDDQIVILWD